MLFTETPIGYIQIPAWEEKELICLSDEQLIARAIDENKHFVISPAVFAMVEKRQLLPTLRKLINPSTGTAHYELHGTPSNF